MKRFICAFSALAATVLLAISCSSFVEDLHLDAVPTATGLVSVKTNYTEHAEFKITASIAENTTVYHVKVMNYPNGFETVKYDWWVDGSSVLTGTQEYYDWDYSDASVSAGNHTIMLIITDANDVSYSAAKQLPVEK